METHYTPELEEFHPGFEFENQVISYCGSSVEWVKTIFGPSDSVDGLFKGLPNDWYELPRIKYLDREDIESLGFDLDQCTKDGCVFYKGNLIDKEEWCLTFGGRTNPKNYLSIHSLKNNYNSFTGTIKNKSELKKILKMLSIL